MSQIAKLVACYYLLHPDKSLTRESISTLLTAKAATRFSGPELDRVASYMQSYRNDDEIKLKKRAVVVSCAIPSMFGRLFAGNVGLCL